MRGADLELVLNPSDWLFMLVALSGHLFSDDAALQDLRNSFYERSILQNRDPTCKNWNYPLTATECPHDAIRFYVHDVSLSLCLTCNHLISLVNFSLVLSWNDEPAVCPSRLSHKSRLNAGLQREKKGKKEAE